MYFFFFNSFLSVVHTLGLMYFIKKTKKKTQPLTNDEATAANTTRKIIKDVFANIPTKENTFVTILSDSFCQVTRYLQDTIAMF